MSVEYFAGVGKIRYEGPASENALAFRWYDPERQVLGKRMEEQLRMAVCFWHSFCWPGSDVFGGRHLRAPVARRRRRADGAGRAEDSTSPSSSSRSSASPFFCFHDRDVAPEGATFRESCAILDRLLEQMQAHMARTGVRLLWGTANLFGHPRYAAGAATNPDPEVFAYAAAQVKHCLDATHRLGGANYVLWGGREGYETLLNTDLARELEQLGRFMALVVEHKHKHRLPGHAPHRAEAARADQAPVRPRRGGGLRLPPDASASRREIKLNIEVNHATLAGHSFQHEVAYALANGIFGSVDANRGDPQLGWDTDQFPNSVDEMALALYEILRAGGFTTGGFNFDAQPPAPEHRPRRSVPRARRRHGHAGRGARCGGAAGSRRGDSPASSKERYQGWDDGLGREILAGKVTLDELWRRARVHGSEPRPRSGRQEMLEGWTRRR